MKKEMHLVYRIDQDDDVKELERISHSEDAFTLLRRIRAYIEENEDDFGNILFKDWFNGQLDQCSFDLD